MGTVKVRRSSAYGAGAVFALAMGLRLTPTTRCPFQHGMELVLVRVSLDFALEYGV